MAGIGSRLCIYRDPAVSIYCQKKEEKFSCTIDAGEVVLESIQSENTLYNEQLKRLYPSDVDIEKVLARDVERFKESAFSGYYILQSGSVIGRAALEDGFYMKVFTSKTGRPYTPARNEVRARVYMESVSMEMYQTVLKVLMVAASVFHQNNILKEDPDGYLNQVDRFIVVINQEAKERQDAVQRLGLQKLGVLGKGCYELSEKTEYSVYGCDMIRLQQLTMPLKASL